MVIGAKETNMVEKVDIQGIEPWTSRMRSVRATTVPNAHINTANVITLSRGLNNIPLSFHLTVLTSCYISAHCSHLTMCLKQFRCNEKLSIHHQRTGDDTVLTWNPSVQVTTSDTSDYLKTAVQSHHPGECLNERAGSQHSAH